MSYSELLNCVPLDATLTDTIKPYLELSSSSAACVSDRFPLTLTDTQSLTLLNGYLSRVATNLSAIYNADKASNSKSWANVNINIKTAVI